MSHACSRLVDLEVEYESLEASALRGLGDNPKLTRLCLSPVSYVGDTDADVDGQPRHGNFAMFPSLPCLVSLDVWTLSELSADALLLMLASTPSLRELAVQKSTGHTGWATGLLINNINSLKVIRQ